MIEYAIVTVMKMGNPMQAAPVEVFVSDKSIGAKISLHNFLQLVAAEIGNPTTLFTNAQLQKKMLHAGDTVLAAMKAETRLVAGGPPNTDPANANP